VTTNPSTSPNAGLYFGRVSWSLTPPEPPSGANSLAREQQWGFFDRVFTWPDEQLFDIPKDPQSRPTRNLSAAGVGQYDGNFTWMVTVLPQFGAGGAWTGNYDRRVVVFYKRDFSPPSNLADLDKPGERFVSVEFTGGGYGGGDVALRTFARTPPYPAAWLDIRENEWILVAAWQNLGTVAAPVPRKVFSWFRVDWIEETARQISTNPTRYERLATLSSTADWNWAWRIDMNGDGAINWSPGSADDIAPTVPGVNPQGVGVICTGVIHVYPIP
jgi:hypothetical protein